jgi:RNA polymerase sigma-70 factor (sigma-E family)
MDFEEFVVTRVPVLVRTAAALCGDVALAEDLVQDVLIKVHRRWPQLRNLDARDSYVRRMVINEFVSWHRKWARIAPRADLAPVDRHPDHATAHAERHLLRQEIAQLPRRQQVVLALRYYDQLTDREIADTLGCPVGTVRSLASRALAALRIDATLRAEYTTDPNPVEQGRTT